MSEARPPAGLRIALLLTVLVGTAQMSTSTYVPSMPSLPAALGTDAATVQLTLTLFLAGSAVGSLMWGSLADRFGRRRVMLAGLVLFIATTFACAASPDIDTLIAARFFQAVGGAVAWVMARAIVRDLYARDQATRIFAIIATAFALAPAVGPVVGGLIEVWLGWRWTFLFLGAFAVAITVVVPRALPETLRQKDPTATRPGRIAANFTTLLRHRRFVGYVVCMGCCMAGLFAFVTAGPFVLITLIGVAPDTYGWLSAIVALAYMAGSQISARSVGRLGHHGMLIAGVAVVIVAAGVLLGYALAGPVPAGRTGIVMVLAPVSVYMIGLALVMPAASAGALEPYAHMAGAASSVASFLQMTIGALGSLAVSLLEDGSAAPMAITIFGAGALVALGYVALVRPGRAAAPVTR